MFTEFEGLGYQWWSGNPHCSFCFTSSRSL